MAVKRALVGYTGFVGGNLAREGDFRGLYNSKNISDAFDTAPDILYYAGVPRQKFIADRDPERDREIIENAARNIERIKPAKLVLISTVDVYGSPRGFSEKDEPVREKPGYGANRLYLEKLARRRRDCLVIRLPGLYGRNLKKNFIYDFIKYVPALLSDGKMAELSAARPSLPEYYEKRDNGFYRVRPEADREKLKKIFRRTGFSALNFTDSRSVYQYYNLSLLYGHAEKALAAGLATANLMTEPVSAGELYLRLTGEEFCNPILEKPLYYDIRTDYAPLFGGSGRYLSDKIRVCRDIKRFVRRALAGEEGRI